MRRNKSINITVSSIEYIILGKNIIPTFFCPVILLITLIIIYNVRTLYTMKANRPIHIANNHLCPLVHLIL